jgi:hypothetical protein
VAFVLIMSIEAGQWVQDAAAHGSAVVSCTLRDGRKLLKSQERCQTKRLASACQVGSLSAAAYPLLVKQALLEEVRRLPDVVCVLDGLLKQPRPAGPVQRLQGDQFHHAVPS